MIIKQNKWLQVKRQGISTECVNEIGTALITSLEVPIQAHIHKKKHFTSKSLSLESIGAALNFSI